MSEDKKQWDQANFDAKMKESQVELLELRMQLQNLLVKFGLRALRTYQAARNVPLRPNEIENLVKYELDNVAGDLSEKEAQSPIINQVKLEWEKQPIAQSP
ncbi:TPA: hypothetical protein HA274_07220 [Candidatus Bathyarchaeota archaeon]|nr:hypothetical protein [Candidatus Bathyarchaeota archaeon]